MERKKWKVGGLLPFCRILYLFLVFSLVPFLSACTKGDGELRTGFEAGRYRIIVAFGDSIVEGYGQPEGWPEILGRELSARFEGVRMFNAGRSGDTAADGLERIRKEVLDREPDLVLIAFGLNDMKNSLSVDSFSGNLADIVERVSNTGGTPVLMTTTRLQKGAGLLTRVDPASFNDAIRKLAGEKGVFLIDVWEDFKGYNTGIYLMDVAHPNAEGYRQLAEIIRKGLIGK